MIRTWLGTISTRQLMSLTMLVLINFIFAYKYLSRETGYSFVISSLYALALIGAFVLLQKIKISWFHSNWFYYGLVFIFCFANTVLLNMIDTNQLNVDRWSVISSFWEQAFLGYYPYNAQSHMGNYPGPLPFYFILALPFHLIGEIGYLTLAGIIAFAVFLRKNLLPSESIGSVIILFLSIPLFWEILARSTIFINGTLFLLYLFWLQKIDFNNRKHIWISAIIAGLLLSTRTLFILPLIIYLVYVFKNHELTLKKLVTWGLIMGGAFVLTFSPLLFFYFDEFLIRNPFSVQTESLLPFRISAAFIILAFIAGFVCSKKSDTTLYTTAFFILIFIVYFLFTLYKIGFGDVYFNSKADISYLLFSLPFLVYYCFKRP